MNIRLATGKITVVARDEEQAMHAGGGEDDGVGKFQAAGPANRDGLAGDRFIHFNHGEPLHELPAMSDFFRCFGAH